MSAKRPKNWFEKQPITIRAAIYGGLFAIIAAFFAVFFDRVVPDNSITTVMLITPTPENFVAVTPLPAPATQEVQLENPEIQSSITLNRAIRIKIPSINLDAPVVLGDDSEQLNKGVGQHIGPQNPGENGIVVLSAHNDSYGELFRFLDHLVAGDSIFLYTKERMYEYIVAKSQVVNTKRADVVFSPDDSILLLISNYPYRVNNQYIIVSSYLKPEPSLPDGYSIFDNFDGFGALDSSKWNLTNASSDCTELQADGYLLIKCNENAASGTVFRFTPTEISYQQISGVAIAAQVQQEVGDSGGKIHVIFRFDNDLSYIMSLRAIKVAVSELNNGASTTLKTQEVDASQLHLLQVEYDGAGLLSFYVDKTLLAQVNIPPDSRLTSWSLEGEEQSASMPRLEQAIIDWIAIRK